MVSSLVVPCFSIGTLLHCWGSCCLIVTCLTTCSYGSRLWLLAIHAMFVMISDLCTFVKLPWKSLWIKASAKWINVNIKCKTCSLGCDILPILCNTNLQMNLPGFKHNLNRTAQFSVHIKRLQPNPLCLSNPLVLLFIFIGGFLLVAGPNVYEASFQISVLKWWTLIFASMYVMGNNSDETGAASGCLSWGAHFVQNSF